MSDKINIVQIQTALLLPITASFIRDKLKIEPIETDKRAMYWSRTQFVDICQALINQITNARNVNFDMVQASRPKKDGAPAEEPKVEAAGDFFGGSTESAKEEAGDFFGGSTESAKEEANDFFSTPAPAPAPASQPNSDFF